MSVDKARSAISFVGDYIDRKIISDHGSNLKYPEKREELLSGLAKLA